MMSLAELERQCEDSLEMLRNKAFLRVTRNYTTPTGQPIPNKTYEVTVGENPEFRIVFEAYQNMLNYVKAICSLQELKTQ